MKFLTAYFPRHVILRLRSAPNILELFLLPALVALSFTHYAEAAPLESARDGSLIAYDDATILDTQSGLMWTRADNGISVDWYGAQRYCAQLRHAGYTDWRLPSTQELATLFPAPRPKAQAAASVSKLLTVSGTLLWSGQTLFEPAFGTEPVANVLNTTKGGKLEVAPKHRADLNSGDPKRWQNLRVIAVRSTHVQAVTQPSDPFNKRVDRFRSRAGALTTGKNLPASLQLALADGLLADDTRASMRASIDPQLRASATASLQRILYPEWISTDANALSFKSMAPLTQNAAPNWTAQWQQSGRWFQVTVKGQHIHVFTELREHGQVATPSEKALSAWSNAREVLQFSETARLRQYEATRGYALVGLAPRPDADLEGWVMLTDGDIVSASLSVAKSL